MAFIDSDILAADAKDAVNRRHTHPDVPLGGNRTIPLNATNIPFDNTTSEAPPLGDAATVQAAIDILSWYAYLNSTTQYDITNMTSTPGNPRPDTWNLRMTAPLIGTYYNYTEFRDEEFGGNLVMTFIVNDGVDGSTNPGRVVWFKYADGTKVYMTNMDGSVLIPSYYPIGQVFGEQDYSLHGETILFLGTSIISVPIEETSIKSFVRRNVPLISQIVGTLTDTPGFARLSAAIAANSIRIDGFRNIIKDPDNYEPAIKPTKINDLGISKGGVFEAYYDIGVVEGLVCSNALAMGSGGEYNGFWAHMGTNPYNNPPVNISGVVAGTNYWIHESGRFVAMAFWASVSQNTMEIWISDIDKFGLQGANGRSRRQLTIDVDAFNAMGADISGYMTSVLTVNPTWFGYLYDDVDASSRVVPQKTAILGPMDWTFRAGVAPHFEWSLIARALPEPPETGEFALQSVDGVIEWVEGE